MSELSSSAETPMDERSSSVFYSYIIIRFKRVMLPGMATASTTMELSTHFLRTRLFVARQDVKFTNLIVKYLQARNNRETKAAVAEGGPIVSMTTHGRRLQTVHLTMESIAAGEMRPSRLILWLDDPTAAEARSSSIRRLEARGVEVRLCHNYGPHTKYYPYLEMAESFDKPLVIADDDVIYHKSWLSGLMTAFQQNGSLIGCYRAHLIKLAEGRLAPYLEWTPCLSSEPSYRHLATGVSGCIYPPRFLERLKDVGPGFLDCCPKADDLWLHVNALRAGAKVHQIYSRQLNFPFIPGTQAGGLWQANVGQSQNDVQIEKTYTASDIDILSSRPG
jgi:hypothetical protein